ncbi:MAG: shikimate kinase [Blautia sp.]|jgi:shikimate kinase
MENVILIGMPGAGKSTIGVVLAKVLGYQFLDSDLLIQRQENRRLSQIIDEEGIEGFKKVEDRVNASICTEQTVIATGGSVVYCENAMEHLKSIGTVVYLELPYGELSKRLGNLRGRGVILRDGQSLQELYQERVPLYEKYADLTVNCENQSLEDSLQAVLDSLQRA